MKYEITSTENVKILTVVIWGPVKRYHKCQNLLDSSINNVKMHLNTDLHEEIMKYEIASTENVNILTVAIWGPIKWYHKCQNLLDSFLGNIKILLHTDLHEEIMKYEIASTENVKKKFTSGFC